MTLIKASKSFTERNKSIFMLMGLTMTLSLVYIAFEWSKARIHEDTSAVYTGAEGEEELIPVTVQQVPVPPPPVAIPQIVEQIQIVDKPVNTETSMFLEPTGNVDIPAATTVVTKPVKEDIEELVIWAEVMPEFKGNVNEYLSKAINYPQVAIENYIQGRVYCEFVVNVDGSITDVKVVRGVDRSLDNEAIRVVKGMPKWKPGSMNGRLVRVKYTLPVVFRLM